MKVGPTLHDIQRVLAADHSVRAKAFSERVRELAAIIHDLDQIPRRTSWSPDEIGRLIQHQEFRCGYCREALGPYAPDRHEVDHRIPWSLGGGNELSNIQVLHRLCNRTKSAQYDDDELLAYLEDRLRNLRKPFLLRRATGLRKR